MTIETINLFFSEQASTGLPLGGLCIGVLFGFAASSINFCTMGALLDHQLYGSSVRLRSWALAIAVCVLLVSFGHFTGFIQTEKSIYVSASFSWLMQIIGGFLFGLGMVLAGGCGARNLLRIGWGDLRSIYIVLVMALFAFMTMGGLLAPLRSFLSELTTIQTTGFGAANNSLGALSTAFDIPVNNWLWGLILGCVLLCYALKDAHYRKQKSQIIGAVTIGGLAGIAWALTYLSYDEMADHVFAPTSLTFIRPMTSALDYFMRATAYETISYFTMIFVGTIVGAFLYAIYSKKFMVQTFQDKKDMINASLGGVLMGIGGVAGLGCSIGQSITGLATLSIGSFLTISAIIAGALSRIVYLKKQI